MRSVNKVILIGNLTKDPVSKDIGDNKQIVTFSLATNRDWMTSTGEKKSLTEFHSIVVWGKLSEICAKFLRKGKLVYIEGYLKTRYWDTEEGTRSSRTEIVAHDMIMLNKKGDAEDLEYDQDVGDKIVFDEIEESIF